MPGFRSLAKISAATLAAFADPAFLGGLLAWQAVRLAPTLSHDPANLALLISDGLPLALVLVRRPARAVTQSAADWLTAYAAALAPILLTPGGHALVDTRLCGLLMVLGLLLNFYGKTSLARSFGLVAANRGVQRSGPYRVIRHPIYAGNAVTQIGFLLANLTLFNLALSLAGRTLQVGRLRTE